jgi:endonuclease G
MQKWSFAFAAVSAFGFGCATTVSVDQLASASTSGAGKAGSIHTALGVPTDGDDSDDYIVSRDAYVLSYNHVRRDPNWVSWHLAATDIGSVGRSGSFAEDPSLPSSVTHATLADFSGSGFQRGHLCPSADRTTTTAENQMTFYLTNVVPQTSQSNEHTWLTLETHERELVQADGKEVYIIAGPIFDDHPSTIGTDKVQVPAEMFKIIVIVDEGSSVDRIDSSTPVIAVRIPDTTSVSGSWTNYRTTIADLQTATGYDFLSALPADVQAALENAQSQ